MTSLESLVALRQKLQTNIIEGLALLDLMINDASQNVPITYLTSDLLENSALTEDIDIDGLTYEDKQEIAGKVETILISTDVLAQTIGEVLSDMFPYGYSKAQKLKALNEEMGSGYELDYDDLEEKED